MKKTDIAMIILIASVSALVAYFASRAIIGDSSSKAVIVKTAEPITTAIEEPDPKIFNKNAINPTVEVIIGGNGQPRSE